MQPVVLKLTGRTPAAAVTGLSIDWDRLPCAGNAPGT